MKKTQALIIFILTISLTAFGQSKILDGSLKWKMLVGEGFQINLPEHWDLDTSGQMGTSFISFSPVLSQDDQFRENVNLLIQDLTGYNLNLDQYVEISENQISTMLTDGQITLSERQKRDEVEYQRLIYTAKQGTFDLKFEQYCWLADEQAFVLTFTCELEEFDNYQKIGKTILKSFEIEHD